MSSPGAFASLLLCMQDDASGSQSNETFDRCIRHIVIALRPPALRPPQTGVKRTSASTFHTVTRYFLFKHNEKCRIKRRNPRTNPNSILAPISNQHSAFSNRAPRAVLGVGISKDRPGRNRSSQFTFLRFVLFRYFLTNSAQTWMPAAANWMQSFV
jgi:hypothetical protein